jgi:hypothetical protein
LTAYFCGKEIDMFELRDAIVIHLFGTNATGVIARFCGFLPVLLLLADVQSASSSRLARMPQKRTLTPVQQPFPG